MVVRIGQHIVHRSDIQFHESLSTTMTNKMLSYRRETALQGALVPHFGTRSLLYFLCSKHCHISLCLATKSVDLWRNLCTIIWYFIVHLRCRRKESSRSLSHLLMSFLYKLLHI